MSSTAQSIASDGSQSATAPPPEAPARVWADAAAIARLNAELQSSALLIHEQQAELAHFRKLFERASAAARIGVWRCDLSDQTLTWTDVVYDLFDLPRGAPITREQILQLYPEHSRLMLERVRSQAIRDRSGFQLDLEIRTALGASRWIRITATVECEHGEPARIFGMKQDITDERILSDKLRYMAEFDPMTGLANRARFQARLAGFDDVESPLHQGGTLMIVDLDGFKQINDTFGHGVGDDCIRRAAATLQEVCTEALIVARIGGDEFGVIWPPLDRERIEAEASRLVGALAVEVSHGGRTLPLSASIGIATGSGAPSDEMFRSADTAMYAAKFAGRGTYRFADVG